MKEEERLNLAQILINVDENFLIALANTGLVRRAQKDLESGGLSAEETDECVIVRGPGWTVWMPPSGPMNARDDTKASSVTRHILSAIIYLRDSWATTVMGQSARAEEGDEATGQAVTGASEKVMDVVAPEQVAAPEKPVAPEQAAVPEQAAAPKQADASDLQKSVLNLTIEDLRKWAGKKLVSEIVAVLAPSVELETEFNLGMTLKLVEHKVEIRVLPTKDKGTKLLDQMLSTAPKALHKRWVVMAILAFQQKCGTDIVSAEKNKVDIVDASQNQKQVLASAAQLLENMLASGVAHPSARQVERLFTLSISAATAGLPRLSHLLKTLSEEVSQLLSREAAADTDRLLSTMSWAYSLVRALAAAAPSVPRDLAGSARSQYDPAGTVALAGVACYPWQTASGYEGVTVLFWNPDQKRFLTWSTSRPTGGAGIFDADQIYKTERIWAGGGAPQTLTRSFFLIMNARINPTGRLSSGKDSTVEIAARVTQSELNFGERIFKNWQALRTYAASQFPIGLRIHDPRDRIVVLQPVSWGERYFDEMQQTFCWPIVDDSSRNLLLTLAWNGTNERAIEFLESFKPGLERVNRVVARMVFSDNGFSVEPLSFLSPGSPRGEVVLNPHFDHKLIESKQSGLLARLRQKFGRERIKTQMTGDDEWDEMLHGDLVNARIPSTIRGVLSETEALLLRVAESGTQHLNEKTQQQFKALADKSSRCGLSELSESLQAIIGHEHVGDRVLQADYLCKLHRQALMQTVAL